MEIWVIIATIVGPLFGVFVADRLAKAHSQALSLSMLLTKTFKDATLVSHKAAAYLTDVSTLDAKSFRAKHDELLEYTTELQGDALSLKMLLSEQKFLKIMNAAMALTDCIPDLKQIEGSPTSEMNAQLIRQIRECYADLNRVLLAEVPKLDEADF